MYENKITSENLMCTRCYHEFMITIEGLERNLSMSTHMCPKCSKAIPFYHVKKENEESNIKIANESENPNPDYIPPAFKNSNSEKVVLNIKEAVDKVIESSIVDKSEISKDKIISELSYTLSETTKENRQLKDTISRKFSEIHNLRHEIKELKDIINNMNKEGE